MKFAVNYSKPALALWHEVPGTFDLFKLPAWEDIVGQVSAGYPAYIHFPLAVGTGTGTVFDFDQQQPVDPARIERLMRQTNTPLVNVHLAPHMQDHPGFEQGDVTSSGREQVAGWMIKDVSAAVHMFGSENVIAENDSGGFGVPAAALLPDVISRVIDETGCGLLLDISHARIVASHLGMDAHEYMAALPVKRLREMHITGIQVFDQSWLDMMTNKGMPEHRFNLSENLGRWMDHLPITDQDWPEIAWVLEQIGNGSWAEPWVASCEYGGIGGGFFEATTDEAVIREQFPRLGKMVKGAFG